MAASSTASPLAILPSNSSHWMLDRGAAADELALAFAQMIGTAEVAEMISNWMSRQRRAHAERASVSTNGERPLVTRDRSMPLRVSLLDRTATEFTIASIAG